MELISFKEIDVEIKRNKIFNKLNFTLKKGDFVGIYGSNGSGKSIFAETLAGRIKITGGSCYRKEGIKIAVVSSFEKDRMLEEDRYNDDSQFMHGKIDPGRSVATILELSKKNDDERKNILENIKMTDILPILDRGIRFLSTGEFRKMLIARALLCEAEVIILDDPFTGLDIDTRNKIDGLIDGFSKSFNAVVIISGRAIDLSKCRKYFEICNGSLKKCSKDDLYKNQYNEVQSTKDLHFKADKAESGESLIRMINVNMSYYDDKILSDINWEVRCGEHWQIIGPNGSGKSSLISLINGDNPKAYSQDIFLFDRKRGSGETVWEIKQKIGLVSGDLQRMHRIDQSVLSVVVSGFFDTVGLYDRPNPVQIEEAKDWCESFGLEDIIRMKFNALSEGQKRRVLIIRALVKKPRVIILDEPCQGLDDFNSGFILDTAAQIIKNSNTTLVYISHDPFYRLAGIDSFMQLVPHEEGGYTATIQRLC